MIESVASERKIGRSIPFLSVHLCSLLVFVYGISWVAVFGCVLSYLIRMFGITAGYHRYFSHRSFKTSRFFQFILACLGASSAQMGPLWWATNHRHHHRHSDTEHDIHSPMKDGIWWSHVGWIISERYLPTQKNVVKDLFSYPELRFIDKFYLIVPVIFAIFVYAIGELLAAFAPTLNTSGAQMLAWGFFLSTVLVYHGTFSINSFAHVIGKRRFNTKDNSKNSLILALITLGEGWHNNHHRYPGSERQGFYWWEIDITHYGLKLLSWFGLVWDLRKPPQAIYEEAKMLSAS